MMDIYSLTEKKYEFIHPYLTPIHHINTRIEQWISVGQEKHAWHLLSSTRICLPNTLLLKSQPWLVLQKSSKNPLNRSTKSQPLLNWCIECAIQIDKYFKQWLSIISDTYFKINNLNPKKNEINKSNFPLLITYLATNSSVLSSQEKAYWDTYWNFERLEPVDLFVEDLKLQREIRKAFGKKQKNKTTNDKIQEDKLILYVCKLLKNSWRSSSRFIFDLDIFSALSHSCVPNATLSYHKDSKTIHIISLIPIFPKEKITISFSEQLCDEYKGRQRLLKLNCNLSTYCVCSFCLSQNDTKANLSDSSHKTQLPSLCLSENALKKLDSTNAARKGWCIWCGKDFDRKQQTPSSFLKEKKKNSDSNKNNKKNNTTISDTFYCICKCNENIYCSTDCRNEHSNGYHQCI